MNAAFIITTVLKNVVPLVNEICATLRIEKPTAEDWKKAFEPIDKTYFDYVTDSKIENAK